MSKYGGNSALERNENPLSNRSGRDATSAESEELSRRLAACSRQDGLHLDASRLGLDAVPAEAFRFPSLSTLQLRGNHIHVISSLESFGYLQKLDLSSNMIERIDGAHLHLLPKLRELILSHNRIEELPNDISRLALLEILYLNNNRLTYLPESMKSMRRLREVDVSHNALGSLGSAMEGSGDRLQMLNVDGNPQLDESAMMPVASHAVQMRRLFSSRAERGAFVRRALDMPRSLRREAVVDELGLAASQAADES